MSRDATVPSAAAGPTARGARRTDESSGHGFTAYFRRAELPLSSLAFLLPLLVIYEVGTRYFLGTTSHGGPTGQRIIAFTMTQQFFNLFGVTGRYLPALAVTVILLTWHIARRDPWHVDASTLIGMSIESVLLAVPLIALGFVAAHYLPLYATAVAPRGLFILSIGAGIYEELVFRLAAFTLLSLLFIDVLRIQRFWSYLLIVAISSVSFAAYHYLGPETFGWRTFVFRTVAGAYFGAIFVFRGFGLSAGSHTAYDGLIVLLRVLAAH